MKLTEGQIKLDFARKHGGAEVFTSAFANEQYVKTYIAEDGATMIEVVRTVWEKAEAEVEVKGVKVKLEKDVKLIETEIWSTDDATSKKFYEPW